MSSNTISTRPQRSRGDQNITVRPDQDRPPAKIDTSGGGSGGGVSDAEKRANARADAAEARAVAREKERQKRAGKRYLEAAENLEHQIRALKQALRVDFKKARDQNLTDLGSLLESQFDLLKGGAKLRGARFLETAANNEKAAAGEASSGISNLVRERADSMTNVLTHGAGETDMLKTMLMSARNWHANAQDSNRAYTDSMSAVNSSITDLRIDTRSAMANAHSQTEGEREKIWQDYYNRTGETYTQIGNLRGQQADYYAQAKEMEVTPPKGKEKQAEKEMKDYFMASATNTGRSYKQKDLPRWISSWEGTQNVNAKQQNTNLAAAVRLEPAKQAEGASLRKWGA